MSILLVEFHYVKETRMMLVAFLALVKTVVASQHKRQCNQTNLCQDLLTIENTKLGLV